MTKISNLPQDTSPTGDDFIPSLDTTNGQTRKVLLSDIGEYIGSYPQNPYKFYAYRSSAYTTYTNGSVVPLNAEKFDSNNDFDITTNVGRWTCSVSGFYWFSGALTAIISGNASTGYSAELKKNGSTALQGVRNVNMYTGSYSNTSVVSGMLQLSAGDYITMAGDGPGGSWSLSYSADGVNTYLQGFLISIT